MNKSHFKLQPVVTLGISQWAACYSEVSVKSVMNNLMHFFLSPFEICISNRLQFSSKFLWFETLFNGVLLA